VNLDGELERSAELNRARAWRDELSALSQARQQLKRTGFVAVLTALSLVGAWIGVAPWLGLAPANGVAGLVSLAVGVIAATMVLTLRKAKAVNPVAVWSMLLLAGAAISFGIVKNGVAAAILVTVAVVLAHVIVGGWQALWYSLALMAVTTYLMVTKGVDPLLFQRVIISGGLVLLFAQLMTRFWADWGERAAAIGADVHEAVVELEGRRVRSEEEAERLRLTDASSGLPNLEGFLALAQPRVAGEHAGSFILISLRLVNWAESLAAFEADVQARLLGALKARLLECHGPGAIVGHIGPEEFLLLASLDDERPHQDLTDELAACSAQMERPLTVDAHAVLTRPRAGVCFIPRDGRDLATLVRMAGLARDHATHHAMSLPVVYDSSLGEGSGRDVTLLGEAMLALAQDQFELHWQPLVTSGQTQLTKAEALIRWNHPQRGRVLPVEFIPTVERSSLIIDLTSWVLQRAAEQVKRWRSTLHPAFQVSVNMPAEYLRRCCERPQAMLSGLTALNLPRQAMVLEITEGVMLELTPEMRQMLAMLKSMGFQVALDDFGVGYSSFAMLEKIQLDFLKLDKSFVDDLESRPTRRAICEAIVTMAHLLGAKVVAEGVERAAQMEWLQAIGVDYLQGYHLSRPIPAVDLERWASARLT
jgi:EAL domain-containing protein (putative c-di-GMP-specific phosphodiesterase class I)/GGDEF domain-containing protein